MTEWLLIDGKTSETGKHQLIAERADNAVGIGTLLARVYEDTPAFGEWTRTARLMARAPELARLAADLAALMLDLGGALTDHHRGTSTTRPLRQTYERDERLLERTQELIGEAKTRLQEIEGGDHDLE